MRKNGFHRIGFILASLLLVGLSWGVVGDPAWAGRLNDDFLDRVGQIPIVSGDSFSFAYIGDVQIRFRIFEEALAKMRADPDTAFLIVGGDAMGRAFEEGYRDFLRRACSVPFPVVALPGNHDVIGDPEASLFHRYVGDDLTSFRVGESLFILLRNTTGAIPKETRLQFEEILASCRDDPGIRHLFVCMHVPPFDPRTDRPGPSMTAKAAEKFFGLLEPLVTPERTVDVLCSHIHGCFFRERGSVRVVVSGGGGGALAGRGDEFFFHYMKVDVRGDRVIFTPVRLAEGGTP
jgi:hypothetical protein